MHTIDFGNISEDIKKNLTPKEIENLNNLFDDISIQEKIQEIINARNTRQIWAYKIVFISIGIGVLLSLIFGSGESIFEKILNGFFLQLKTTKEIFSPIISLVTAISVIGITYIYAKFKVKIDTPLKTDIFKKITPLIDPFLAYSHDEKYSFDDLIRLGQGGLIQPYGNIECVEDSIFLEYKNQNPKSIMYGFRLKTSQIRGTGKNKRRVITNNCYITKIIFPNTRLPSGDAISIITDRIDKPFLQRNIYLILLLFISFILSSGMIQLATKNIFIIFSMSLFFSGACVWIAYTFQKKILYTNRVVIDDGNEFEKKFDIKCRDQDFCNKILTKEFTNQLLSFIKITGNSYEFMFCDDAVYIKRNIFNEEYLNPKMQGNTLINIENFAQFYIDMRELLLFSKTIGDLYITNTIDSETNKITTNNTFVSPINFTKNKNMLIYTILHYLY